MGIEIRQFTSEDTEEAVAIWNDVVRDGVAFPQTEERCFRSQRTRITTRFLPVICPNSARRWGMRK